VRRACCSRTLRLRCSPLGPCPRCGPDEQREALCDGEHGKGDEEGFESCRNGGAVDESDQAARRNSDEDSRGHPEGLEQGGGDDCGEAGGGADRQVQSSGCHGKRLPDGDEEQRGDLQQHVRRVERREERGANGRPEGDEQDQEHHPGNGERDHPRKADGAVSADRRGSVDHAGHLPTAAARICSSLESWHRSSHSSPWPTTVAERRFAE
jgi:hypothetical protein